MESFLWFALSNAILATLLAVLAAVLGCFCRRPAVRHALWLLVLLKLITPPLLPISVTWPRSEDSKPPPEVTPPIRAATVRERLSAPLPYGRGSDFSPTIGAATVRERLSVPLPDGRGSALSLALLVFWLGGALVWWTVAAVRLRKFQRLLHQARPAPADVQEQARRLAALLGLRRCPPIAFVSAPLSPMLWALGLSPRLLLPSELWPRLEKEQQDTLLAHELAHLRRGDHWLRRLEFLVLGLYWWHPVVWWARRRLQEAEEECCDAVVIAMLPDAAPAYASALVETVAFLSQSRAAARVGASGAGQVPLLKRRLSMILMTTSPRRSSRLAFWIVLGLGALLLPLAPRAARTEAPEKSEGAQEKGPQVQHREASKPLSTAPERTRDEEIEKLQDEIELLKLKVQLKDARRAGTQEKFREFQRRYTNMIQLNRRNPGTIPSDILGEVNITVTGLKTEAAVQEIEWKEATLLLKQAERRLVRLQGPAKKTEGGGRAEQEKRLRKLEQKVESLLKEIHDLRREMQREKPRPSGQTSAAPFEERLWKVVGLRLRALGAPLKARSGEFRGGMVVDAIRPISPAWGSGLQKGDILVGLDKFEVLSKEDVQYPLTRSELADKRQLKFFYLRAGELLKNGIFELGK